MQETGYETFSFYYDALTENVDYPARAAYLDGLVQKYLRSGGKVMLDLACGTGTLTEEMAKRGYDMIGVDYSEGMLGQAMEKRSSSSCRSNMSARICGNWNFTVPWMQPFARWTV